MTCVGMPVSRFVLVVSALYPRRFSNGAPIGWKWKTNIRFVVCFLSFFYGTSISIIGLKAPGNYSDQFWSNKIVVLLCVEPKPNISMTSGFVRSWEPVFMDLNIPKYYNETKKQRGHIFEKYDLCKSVNLVF